MRPSEGHFRPHFRPLFNGLASLKTVCRDYAVPSAIGVVLDKARFKQGLMSTWANVKGSKGKCLSHRVVALFQMNCERFERANLLTFNDRTVCSRPLAQLHQHSGAQGQRLRVFGKLAHIYTTTVPITIKPEANHVQISNRVFLKNKSIQLKCKS